MTKTTFDVNQYSQDVAINAADIMASHDALNSFLTVPVSLVLRMIDSNIYESSLISAQLKLVSHNALLSETEHSFYRLVSPKYSVSPTAVHLRFTLSDRAIALIEKVRTGDVGLYFELAISFKKGIDRNPSTNSTVAPVWGMSESTICTLYVNIPRSTWVERILPNLGYRNLRLVEIPVRHERLKEAYEGIILAFDNAEKHFNNHDYNECVSQCRKTLEEMHKEFVRMRKMSDSSSKFDWFNNAAKATQTWIDEMDKRTYSLASVPVHQIKVSYSRTEAESIYLVVLGLVHFVGNL